MTKQQEQWLLSQIEQFPELSPRELTSYLNDKVLVDNPVPIGQVSVKTTLEEVSAVVTDAEVLALAESPGNLTTLKRGGKLTQASFDAIIALLQRTQLDPNYQAQILITPAELAGHGVILVSDVEELLTP
jgi:hypothetical protein